MLYLVINREGINDAVNECSKKAAIKCSKNKIASIAAAIKPDEIILIWEETSSNPLWIVSDKVYLETLAYIDTYIKKYIPFTAFYRVMHLSSFLNDCKIKKRVSNIDSDILIGVIIAEAHMKFDRSLERENTLPIQAYLSTLSATLISAINSGYSLEQIPSILENWEATYSLLYTQGDDGNINELSKFWISVLCNVFSSRTKDFLNTTENYLPLNVERFISSYKDKGIITDKEWKILVNASHTLRNVYTGLVGTREEGMANFGNLFNALKIDKTLSNVEVEVILAVSLSILSTGTMDYFSLALSISDHCPMVPYWYMLFTGMHKKRQIFKTAYGIGNHLKKHLIQKDNLFSQVSSDISYPELQMVLANQINTVPFITAHKSLIDVEIYPLVKAKFKINRDSDEPKNKTKDGVFLTTREYNEIRNALFRASKTLGKKKPI